MIIFCCSDQPEHVQTPEASSLLSMPGLSKEDRPKDSSDVIDTGELVDTLLNDHSLLEKIAKNINKSIEAQRETDDRQESKILDPPILEKALDSTQSDPEIKNILDEFLGKFELHSIYNYLFKSYSSVKLMRIN